MQKHFTPFHPPAKFWANSWLSLMQLVANGLLKSAMLVSSYFLIKDLSRAIKQQQNIATNSLFLLLAIALVLLILRVHERYVSEKMSQRYINRVRSTLLKRLMRASIRVVQDKTIGNLSSRLAGDLSAVKRWLSLGIARLLTHSLLISILLIFIFSINTKLGLMMSVAVLVLMASSMLVGQLLKKRITLVRKNRIKIHSLLVERLSSIITIRAMGKELPEVRKINRQADKLEQNIAAQGVMLGLLRGIGDASGFILIAILFIFNQLNANILSVQEITALISLVMFLNSPIRELGRVQEYYQGAKLSFFKLEELFVIPRIIRGKSKHKTINKADGSVVLKNITLKPLFKQLNLTAKSGEHIAITGNNGSGKSTIIALMLGLIKPDAGTIRVNNCAPSRTQSQNKALNIGVSGVNLNIIRGSLLRNLTYRVAKYNEQDFQQLLKFCQLEDLIKKLPKGLNTLIKENGTNFSSGEKARISLFRALLAQPSLLILDEPESYLDAQGLHMITDLLKNYAGTILIATHHKQLIELCHRQWNLSASENNKITISNNLKLINNNESSQSNNEK